MFRATVTRASRLMVPTHALFSSALGAIWATQASERTAVPSLYALRHVWPIQATGGVLFCIGLLGFAAMLVHKRTLAATLLMAGSIAYALLTVAVLASLQATDLASFSAPLWPAYVA